MLTPKQEKFAQGVASGKTQADAYRAAYDAKNMKAETIQKRASELMSDGAISGRVKTLREPIVKKVGITLESHLDDMMKLRNMAAKEKQYGAAIAAEIARGKAAGVHIEKQELAVTSQVTLYLPDNGYGTTKET